MSPKGRKVKWSALGPMNEFGEVQIGGQREKMSATPALAGRDANLSPLSAAPRFEW